MRRPSAREALAGVLLRLAAPALLSFQAFVARYKRSYGQTSAEYQQRQALYEERVADAERHNRNPRRRWTAGVSGLWDWTATEMAQIRGWNGAARPLHSGGHPAASRPALLKRGHTARNSTSVSKPPREKDWTHLKAINYIQDQGNCGSCWALAAATTLQAHAELHTKTSRTFSAQQILACTPNPRECGGSGGCGGATIELAMDWVLEHGCAEEAQDPYRGVDSSCSHGKETAKGNASDGGGPDWKKLVPGGIFQPAVQKLPPGGRLRARAEGSAGALAAQNVASDGGRAFGMHGWETLPKNTYEPLLKAVATLGPVGVSADAEGWFSYHSGIFDSCGKDAIINHALVLVGYGEDASSGDKYWVLHNSWGADWGEGGRMRLLRHDDPAREPWCGMDSKPQLGTACKGEDEPVPVCGMCGVLFDSVVPHFQST